MANDDDGCCTKRCLKITLAAFYIITVIIFIFVALLLWSEYANMSSRAETEEQVAMYGTLLIIHSAIILNGIILGAVIKENEKILYWFSIINGVIILIYIALTFMNGLVDARSIGQELGKLVSSIILLYMTFRYAVLIRNEKQELRGGVPLTAITP